MQPLERVLMDVFVSGLLCGLFVGFLAGIWAVS